MLPEHQSKTPPHSKESEMMVLGCMLTSLTSLKVASEALEECDFYFTEHKIIFRSLKNAYKDDRVADVHIIAEDLKRQNQLQTVGGVIYLTTLAQFAGTSAYIEEYIETVKHDSQLRECISLAQELQTNALATNADPQRIIDTLSRRIQKFETASSRDESLILKDVISGDKSQTETLPFIKKLKARYDYFQAYERPFLSGIPTGFEDLDKEAIILEDTNLIIVAARPAMGKTALGLNIAGNVCFEQNLPVAFISLEMGRDQLLERLLAMQTGIYGEQIKRGTLTASEFAQLEKESVRLAEKQLFIIDHGCSSISKVVKKARSLKDNQGIRLLVLDYLQLLGTNTGTDSRQYEVAEISRQLKLLAMELKIPILCIAQLSRKVEERTSKEPLMSDLRDSGQIEQDADVILFIYRKEYYTPTDMPGHAELIVRKNRNGPEPKITLHFEKGCGKFSSMPSVSLFQQHAVSF